VYRRYEGNRQFFSREEEESESESGSGSDPGDPGRRGGPRTRRTVVRNKFRTSGNSVALLSGLSLASYVALLVLVLNLAPS